MTALELLAGSPQRNPVRNLIWTLVPTRTRITQGEPLETTCTAGFGTIPQTGNALGSVVEVAPAVEVVIANSDESNAATLSARRRWIPRFPLMSPASHSPLNKTCRVDSDAPQLQFAPYWRASCFHLYVTSALLSS